MLTTMLFLTSLPFPLIPDTRIYTNFRQEYDVREERRRELEFLVKVRANYTLLWFVPLCIAFSPGLCNYSAGRQSPGFQTWTCSVAQCTVHFCHRSDS